MAQPQSILESLASARAPPLPQRHVKVALLVWLLPTVAYYANRILLDGPRVDQLPLLAGFLAFAYLYSAWAFAYRRWSLIVGREPAPEALLEALRQEHERVRSAREPPAPL